MSYDWYDFYNLPHFEDCQGMDTLIEIRRLMKEGKEAQITLEIPRTPKSTCFFDIWVLNQK